MDCLYRYVDDFTYLGFFDRDEMIIPSQRYTWAEMIEELETRTLSYWEQFWQANPASFLYEEACFESEMKPTKYVIGEKLRMYLATKETRRLLRFRGRESDACHTKTIVKPNAVIDMYVHHPQSVLPGFSLFIGVDPGYGRINHYKNPAGICGITDDTAVTDYIMKRYNGNLIKNMELKLSEIKPIMNMSTA